MRPDNMRGVTGGCMSMGLGVFHARSSKQKINTKSSTETELVGASEYLPFNIWALNFLEAQGYKIENNVLFQDNQGAMLMEKNGRNSCTGNSRHISIRYFFIKDRVDKGEVKVEYCPTYLMIADFFTKPLQGSMFRLFRDVIMGYRPLEDIMLEIPMKERVGNRIVSQEASKLETGIIGIPKGEQQNDTIKHLITNKRTSENNELSKRVTWKDKI